MAIRKMYSRTVETVTKFLCGKWALSVLSELSERAKRFGELCVSLKANTAALTSTLRRLESGNFIYRVPCPENSAYSLYALTEKGRDFENVFREMERWCRKWTEKDPDTKKEGKDLVR